MVVDQNLELALVKYAVTADIKRKALTLSNFKRGGNDSKREDFLDFSDGFVYHPRNS